MGPPPISSSRRIFAYPRISWASRDHEGIICRRWAVVCPLCFSYQRRRRSFPRMEHMRICPHARRDAKQTETLVITTEACCFRNHAIAGATNGQTRYRNDQDWEHMLCHQPKQISAVFSFFRCVTCAGRKEVAIDILRFLRLLV